MKTLLFSFVVSLALLVCVLMIGSLACSQQHKQSAEAQPQGAGAKPQQANESTPQPISTFRMPTATEVFNLRSECAKLGKKIMEDNPSGNSNYYESQVSHYNPATNRCFVEVDHQITNEGVPFVLHRSLYDGQTGELLATFDVKCPTTNGYIGGCPRFGTVFGSGFDIIQGNKALVNTDKLAIHDNASEAEAFIDNVMLDDRKQ